MSTACIIATSSGVVPVKGILQEIKQASCVEIVYCVKALLYQGTHAHWVNVLLHVAGHPLLKSK